MQTLAWAEMQMELSYERAETAMYEAMEAAIEDGVDPEISRGVQLCYAQNLEGMIRELVRVSKACSICRLQGAGGPTRS